MRKLKLILPTPLVKYPVKRMGHGGDIGIPMGLLYLASYARENNPNIDIKIQTNRLNQYLGINRNLERDFYEFDIVATGACTVEYPDALLMLSKAKEMGKITVMGGIFPTANVDFILNSGVVDYIIRGEGEIAFSELLKCLSYGTDVSSINGISYRLNNQNIHNPSMDLIKDVSKIPLPAYDLIDMKMYSELVPGAIYSARGCPMSCKFCTLNQHWGYKYRARTIDNILLEIQQLVNFGFKRIHFKDETLTLNKKRTMELFKALSGYGLKFKGKSRIDTIDKELLEVMCNSGLDTLHFGVENISQKALDSMKKEIKSNDIKYTLRMIKDYCKINPVFLFGWIGETYETLSENCSYIEEIGVEESVIPYISFITPHPGSNLENNPYLQTLTYDLNRYTHKQPVAVPLSLGENGLRKMVENFNYLSAKTGTELLNPIIQEDYLKELDGGMKKWKLKSRQNALTILS